jgi:hypothetical protein
MDVHNLHQNNFYSAVFGRRCDDFYDHRGHLRCRLRDKRQRQRGHRQVRDSMMTILGRQQVPSTCSSTPFMKCDIKLGRFEMRYAFYRQQIVVCHSATHKSSQHHLLQPMPHGLNFRGCRRLQGTGHQGGDTFSWTRTHHAGQSHDQSPELKLQRGRAGCGS